MLSPPACKLARSCTWIHWGLCPKWNPFHNPNPDIPIQKKVQTTIILRTNTLASIYTDELRFLDILASFTRKEAYTTDCLRMRTIIWYFTPIIRPDKVNYLILWHFYSKIDEGMRLFFSSFFPSFTRDYAPINFSPHYPPCGLCRGLVGIWLAAISTAPPLGA